MFIASGIMITEKTILLWKRWCRWRWMLICTLQTQAEKALTIIVLRFSRKGGVGTKDDGRGSSGNDDGPSLISAPLIQEMKKGGYYEKSFNRSNGSMHCFSGGNSGLCRRET